MQGQRRLKPWVYLSFLFAFRMSVLHAVEEVDLTTGESNAVEEPAYVEPVYLDNIDKTDSNLRASRGEVLGRDEGISMDLEQPGANTPNVFPPGKWQIYGSLGMSTVSFNARAAVRYPLHQFFSVDPSFTYWSRRDGEYAGNGFGPEVAVIARGKNPTMFTPYTGVGLGYEKWEQSMGENQFDHDDSGTAFYFFGLNIMMTKHFGFDVARRIKKYADHAPLDKDSKRAGDNPEVSTELSFQAIF